MAEKKLRARLNKRLGHNQASDFGPERSHEKPERPGERPAPEQISAKAQPEISLDDPDVPLEKSGMIPFAEIDLSRWGVVEPSEGSVIRMQGRISERHHRILETVAKRQRTTNRAALERILELFVESGEFAELMNRPGF